MSARVLVVEDDPTLREAVSLVLTSAGFDPVVVGDGAAALTAAVSPDVHVVVLDLMLPGADGFEVLRHVRSTSSVPVVVLTAKTETTSLVAALELGADDYITKPFDPSELIARLRAALRRATANGSGDALRLGELEIDVDAFVLRKRGAPIDVSATEFRILVELVRAGTRVLTREQLLQRVWNYSYLGDSRLVDMAVKRLRAKIEDVPSAPRYVVTVRGVGYRAGC